MADKTGIEWTDATWNTIRARNKATGKVGWFCTKPSAGCKNCYAERWNVVRGNGIRYAHDRMAEVEIFLDEKVLTQPLRWKRPRMIFPCSMTDLFGEWVKDEWLDRIFAVMALAPQHTFQVLTKRPRRMADYLLNRQGDWDFLRETGEFYHLIQGKEGLLPHLKDAGWLFETYRDEEGNKDSELEYHGSLPLPNVWLGVSVEDQATADERIPCLLDTPAIIRFLSCEPLLDPINLSKWLAPIDENPIPEGSTCDWGGCDGPTVGYRNDEWSYGWLPVCRVHMLFHWVIVGGESGPGARPMHPDWARSIRDQCLSAGVAFHFKQRGEWTWDYPQDLNLAHQGMTYQHGMTFYRVGKKAAGRLLDGREWNEFPATTGCGDRQSEEAKV